MAYAPSIPLRSCHARSAVWSASSSMDSVRLRAVPSSTYTLTDLNTRRRSYSSVNAPRPVPSRSGSHMPSGTPVMGYAQGQGRSRWTRANWYATSVLTVLGSAGMGYILCASLQTKQDQEKGMGSKPELIDVEMPRKLRAVLDGLGETEIEGLFENGNEAGAALDKLVLIPKNLAEVATIVKTAASCQVPIIPFSSASESPPPSPSPPVSPPQSVSTSSSTGLAMNSSPGRGMYMDISRLSLA